MHAVSYGNDSTNITDLSASPLWSNQQVKTQVYEVFFHIQKKQICTIKSNDSALNEVQQFHSLYFLHLHIIRTEKKQLHNFPGEFQVFKENLINQYLPIYSLTLLYQLTVENYGIPQSILYPCTMQHHILYTPMSFEFCFPLQSVLLLWRIEHSCVSLSWSVFWLVGVVQASL